MSWIFTVAVIIVLVIIAFLFVIIMPKPVVFFEPYVDLHAFTDRLPDIQSEITKCIQTNRHVNPVVQLVSQGHSWDAVQYYPLIYSLIYTLPGVEYAGVLYLRPKFNQKKQMSQGKNVNHTYRYFYAVQTCVTKAGIWIDGEKRFFSEGKWICCDVSREHALFNKNKYERAVVLFVDIMRPETSPLGCASKKDNEQDDIMAAFQNNAGGQLSNVDNQDEPKE